MRPVHLLLFCALFLIGCTASTPPILDENGSVVQGSAAQLEMVTLDGVDQFICIRGRSTQSPILIVVHGGPGSPVLGQVRRYNGDLENHFIVVNWDQRGTGKSFSPAIAPESMNAARIARDLHELAVILTRRFNQRKVIIMAHAWGTIPGLMFVRDNPDLVHAYVGIGQAAHRPEQEAISYDFTLAMARRRGETRTVRELENILFSSPGVYSNPQDVRIQRKWLIRFGGVSHDPAFRRGWMWSMLSAQEYGIMEKISIYRGLVFSMTHLLSEFTHFNAYDEVKEVAVPVIGIGGVHDRLTPLSTVQSYLDYLKAPLKKLFVFENSGNLANFEEPERFGQIMVEEVLPLCETEDNT